MRQRTIEAAALTHRAAGDRLWGAMSKPKFWGVVSPLPAPVVTMQAKMAEDAGLEGVFAPQVYGPPFIPLAAAAARCAKSAGQCAQTGLRCDHEGSQVGRQVQETRRPDDR